MIEDQAPLTLASRDQAIRQLVLDRLELADRLPELVSFPGVVNGQLERTPRSAKRARPASPCSLMRRSSKIDGARRQCA